MYENLAIRSFCLCSPSWELQLYFNKHEAKMHFANISAALAAVFCTTLISNVFCLKLCSFCRGWNCS